MAGTAVTVRQEYADLTQVDRQRLNINSLISDVEIARRILSINTTAVSNASTAETDLMTYALAAAKLATTGAGIRVRAWGTTTNNANVKTLKVYFGTTAHISIALTASQAGRWVVDLNVFRTGASTQDVSAELREVTAALAAGKGAHVIATDTQTDTAAITVKVTGTSGTASADINCEGMIVEFLPTATELTAYTLNTIDG